MADKKWVRPVSDTADGTVPTGQTFLDDGKPLGVLDLVAFDASHPLPDVIQPENVVYVNGEWRREGRLTNKEAKQLLASLEEPGPELLGNASGSIDPNESAPMKGSLAIVRPDEITWEVTTDFYDRPRLKCHFDLNGQSYALTVTDPAIEARAAELPLGLHQRSMLIEDEDTVWLTVSLAEPFEVTGKCYKLVAAVIALS